MILRRLRDCLRKYIVPFEEGWKGLAIFQASKTENGFINTSLNKMDPWLVQKLICVVVSSNNLISQRQILPQQSWDSWQHRGKNDWEKLIITVITIHLIRRTLILIWPPRPQKTQRFRSLLMTSQSFSLPSREMQQRLRIHLLACVEPLPAMWYHVCVIDMIYRFEVLIKQL